MEFILKEDRPARPAPPRPLARAHDQARTPQGLHTYNLSGGSRRRPAVDLLGLRRDVLNIVVEKAKPLGVDMLAQMRTPISVCIAAKL